MTLSASDGAISDILTIKIKTLNELKKQTSNMLTT